MGAWCKNCPETYATHVSSPGLTCGNWEPSNDNAALAALEYETRDARIVAMLEDFPKWPVPPPRDIRGISLAPQILTFDPYSWAAE